MESHKKVNLTRLGAEKLSEDNFHRKSYSLLKSESSPGFIVPGQYMNT